MCALLALGVLGLSGCYDYTDMNKLYFTTLIIHDSDGKQVKVYYECFKAYRGEGEKAGTERREVFSGSGRTAYEAFTETIKAASFPLEYSQNKALVFTEQAAKNGLAAMMDGPARNQKFNPRQYVFICSDDPTELMAVNMKDEQFLGLFLENSMVNLGYSSNMVRLRFDQMKLKRLLGSGVYVVPMICTIDQMGNKRLDVNNAAVIADDKMVGTLNTDEVRAYSYVNNTADRGVVLARTPGEEGKYVSLQVLSSKSKGTVIYDGQAVHAKRTVDMTVSLEASQALIDPTDDAMREAIALEAEDWVRQKILDLYTTYERQGIDVYNITLDFERTYPRESTEKLIEKTDLEVEVNIFIEGSQNLTDTQEMP